MKSDKSPQLPEGLLYRAFLSYRSTDRRLAEVLVRKLELWTTPRGLVGKEGNLGPIPRRLGRICRDRDEFPTSAYVDMVIAEKLSQSQMLIVLCTPDSADERSWVNREIDLFRKLRPDGAVHAIIGRGDPPGCFPKALLTRDSQDVIQQPLAADMRRLGDGPEKAVVKLIAGVLGTDFDTLWRRERRRRRGRVLRRFCLFAAAITIAGYWAAWVDASNWRSKITTESIALWSEGRTLDALSMALAGAGSLGGFLPVSGDESSAALSRLPGTALKFDVGSNVSAYNLSPDGSRIALLEAPGRALQTEASLVSLESGESWPLGFVDNTPKFGPGSSIVVAQSSSVEAIIVFDAATGRELARIPHPSMQFEFAGLDSHLVIYDEAKSGKLLNWSTSEAIDLPPIKYEPIVSEMAPNIAIVSANSDAMFVDRDTGLVLLVPGIARFGQFDPSGVWISAENNDGDWLVVRQADQHQTWLGDLIEPPQFLPDGRALIWTQDFSAGLVELESGDTLLLGKTLSEPAVSADNRFVVLAGEDSKLWLSDLYSNAKRLLGPGIAPEFSSDGRWLRAVGWDGVSFINDLETGTTRTLRGLSGSESFSFSSDSRFMWGLDEQSGFILDLDTGDRIPIGKADDFPEFTLGGHLLIAQSHIHALVADPRASQGAEGSPQEILRRWCSSDGISPIVRPINAELRDPDTLSQLESDEQARRRLVLTPIVRGRPWNPCDWRGLGAILPDDQSGDGWFEGGRQFIRLLAIRWFNAPDYSCEETVSSANEEQRSWRTKSCALAQLQK